MPLACCRPHANNNGNKNVIRGGRANFRKNKNKKNTTMRGGVCTRYLAIDNLGDDMCYKNGISRSLLLFVDRVYTHIHIYIL